MSMTDVSPSSSAAARATRGRVPILQPLINSVKLDVTFREAKITRGEGQHDQAVLACSSSTLTNTDGLVEQPISFFYGQAPRTELFTGYVKQVQLDESKAGTFDFTLGCLGVTSTMASGKPRWWNNKSIPSVVRDLSLYNLLGFFGDEHPHLWLALAQTGESDWARANDLCARIGFAIYNHLGVVLCYDPLHQYSAVGPYARLVSGQNVQVSDRQLVGFTPQEVDTTSRETQGIQFSYFTTGNGVQTAKQRGDFKQYGFVPILARDQTEATTLLDAFDSYTSRWTQHATARMWGDADIYPGVCVEVVTAQQAWADKRYNGKWLVREVGHSMDRQQYQTMLSLSRPDQSNPVQVVPFRHFWNADGRARPTLSLADGVWTSSWTDRTVRSVM